MYFMPLITARIIKVKLHVQKLTEIMVFGKRDPRGPDNNIYMWVDSQDKLHIRVLKAQRCYEFEKVIETEGFIEVVQK